MCSSPRAAASLGIESVAVFTPADSQSLHTKLADKAHEIGFDLLAVDSLDYPLGSVDDAGPAEDLDNS